MSNDLEQHAQVFRCGQSWRASLHHAGSCVTAHGEDRSEALGRLERMLRRQAPGSNRRERHQYPILSFGSDSFGVAASANAMTVAASTGLAPETQ